jgi:FtsZ-interacting cell division protein ZipA
MQDKIPSFQKDHQSAGLIISNASIFHRCAIIDGVNKVVASANNINPGTSKIIPDLSRNILNASVTIPDDGKTIHDASISSPTRHSNASNIIFIPA